MSYEIRKYMVYGWGSEPFRSNCQFWGCKERGQAPGASIEKQNQGAHLPVKVYYHANFQVDPTNGVLEMCRTTLRAEKERIIT